MKKLIYLILLLNFTCAFTMQTTTVKEYDSANLSLIDPNCAKFQPYEIYTFLAQNNIDLDNLWSNYLWSDSKKLKPIRNKIEQLFENISLSNLSQADILNPYKILNILKKTKISKSSSTKTINKEDFPRSIEISDIYSDKFKLLLNSNLNNIFKVTIKLNSQDPNLSKKIFTSIKNALTAYFEPYYIQQKMHYKDKCILDCPLPIIFIQKKVILKSTVLEIISLPGVRQDLLFGSFFDKQEKPQDKKSTFWEKALFIFGQIKQIIDANKTFENKK